MLSEGASAPGFTAQDQNGNIHTLTGYKGKWLLLYFYPKDNTPGCTKEACAIRDSYDSFKQSGLAVLGVSADSADSHKTFAEKYELPFPLLADPDKKILKNYQAIGEKNIFGKKIQGTLRISYLINPDSVIAKAYVTVKPALHAEQVLSDIKGLR